MKNKRNEKKAVKKKKKNRLQYMAAFTSHGCGWFTELEHERENHARFTDRKKTENSLSPLAVRILIVIWEYP